MNKIVKFSAALCALLSVASCSSLDEQDESLLANTNQVEVDLGIHERIINLGNNLFNTSNSIDLNKGVAVGTFLPLSQFNGKSMPTNNLLGYQIQESFVTVGTQAGLKVIEFKTMNAIKFSEKQDIMLSRQIADLPKDIAADYFLTGNYVQQEQRYVVNARLINIKTQQVVAAATDYLPLDIMADLNKTTLKSNLLYRKEY